MAEQQWLVVTGAASGIMEAGHIGAGREHSMGLNIMLPFEQYANPIIAGDSKLVHMKYFFTRKLMFVKECDAVALLPGGFGTLDEGFEVLTLLQTGKRDIVPVVFLDSPGGSFWREFIDFIDRRFAWRHVDLKPEDQVRSTSSPDNVDAAVQEILAGLFPARTTACGTSRTSWCCVSTRKPRGSCWIRSTSDFGDILSGGDFIVRPAARGTGRAGPGCITAAGYLPLQSPQPGTPAYS